MPRSAIGDVSGCRYVSNCRSRGCEFNPFGGRSRNNFTVIILPSADSKRVAVSYKGKYVHELLTA